MLRKANPLCSIDFASQSPSIMMDWLCFAKPIHHDGLALLRKAFPSDGWALLIKAFSMMDWLCFAKPVHFDWIALLRKASPLWRIGMALLRKAIPVIPLSGRFWIFVRGLQFFPGFRIHTYLRRSRINRLWCPPGVRSALELGLGHPWNPNHVTKLGPC